MWSNQENRVRKQVKIPCEVVAYAMRSSGKTSLAVGLSPYKIAKKDVLASKLAGRFFHHFAWLVAFTNSSQKISTHTLIMEVDFCPVLCIPKVAILQAFRGISHFVWYCKAVSDLSQMS